MDWLEMLGIILAVGGVTLAVWVCLPDLLLLLGLTGIRQGVEASREGVVPCPGNPISEDLDAEVTALGFDPAGVYWETIPAHKVFREYVYASKTSDCYALVYQLFDNDPPRVAFITGFVEQAYVLTQNYRHGLTADRATFRAGGLPLPEGSRPPAQPDAPCGSGRWVWAVFVLSLPGGLFYLGLDPSWWKWVFVAVAAGLAVFMIGESAEAEPSQNNGPLPDRDPLSEVLAEHYRRLAHFRSLGYTIRPASDIDDFLQLQQGYHQHPVPWWELRSATLLLLPVKVGFLALGPAILAYFLGIAHPLVGAALFLASLSVLYFRRYGFPIVEVMAKRTQRQLDAAVSRASMEK